MDWETAILSTESMDTDAPLTVIVPFKDAAETIDACLESVFAANLTDLQIVIVDDGSDDAARESLQPWADHRDVTVLRQGPLGVSQARNRGLAEASSPYVMFVDADDLVVGPEIPRLLRAAQQCEADIAVSDFVRRGQNGDVYHTNINSNRRLFSRHDRATLQSLCLASIGFRGAKNIGLLGAPWAKIYRRTFLLEAFEADSAFKIGVKRGQDVLFNVEAFGRASRVVYYPHSTYIYRVDSDSASHRPVADFVDRAELLIAELENLILREGWDELWAPLRRLQLLLMDEAVRRASSPPAARTVRKLLDSGGFRQAVKASRYGHLTLRSKVKLFLLRHGAYRPYVVTVRGSFR